ncbi:MAG: hypothetical protein M1838_006010 [Thelocarpon superellum]|nr:MAG: hypothetical protein M1838_006010 [Thelocarpon superellum]
MALSTASKMKQGCRRIVYGSRSSSYYGNGGPPAADDLDNADEGANEQSTLLGSRRTSYRSEVGETGWKKYPRHVLYVTKATLFSNYVNVLLVFVPLGIVSGALGWNATVVFVLNFLAIVPLASLLSFATEELAAKLGQTIGGLMNATFGNAVELIVSIVALNQNEIRIVQASMIGSILSNLLLVLGTCFLVGGWGRVQQTFNMTAASTMSSLLAVASNSLIIPAALYAALSKSSSSDTEEQILILSHGTALIILVLYVMYLYFQLRSHAHLFDEEESAEDEAVNGEPVQKDEEEHILSPISAGVALVVVTVMVAVCAEFLVDSIAEVVETTHMSKTFIGLILLPIVGNAAEHVTAVVVAHKDKMDLAIGVAIGSSLQIALLVTPFLVILGWIMDRQMTLHFETFETVVFFLSTTTVNYLIQDGKSNYLEGAMLIGTYVIIALAFFVYPDDADDGGAFVLTSLKGMVGM